MVVKDGKPLSNATIRIYSSSGGYLTSVQTNATGYFNTSLPVRLSVRPFTLTNISYVVLFTDNDVPLIIILI